MYEIKIEDLHHFFNMAAGKRTHNRNNGGKCYVKGYFVCMAHKNKMPTAIAIFSGLTFSVATTFMPLGVAVTPEVNMAVMKAEVGLLALH